MAAGKSRMGRMLCCVTVAAGGAAAFMPPVPAVGRLWAAPAVGCGPVLRASPSSRRHAVLLPSAQRRPAAEGPSAADWPELERLQPFGDNRTPDELLRDGQKLVEDGYKLALETPPEVGVRRTLQASRAVLTTGTELLRKFQGMGRAPTTEELLAEVPATLRRLFELLGATYIKLGQFVASSPTLFPAEYVTEFQKCLDDTEPVPFARIKRVIEADLKIKDVSEVFASVTM